MPKRGLQEWTSIGLSIQKHLLRNLRLNLAPLERKWSETMSGEKQGTRDRIDAMVSQMVQSGTSAEYARKKAVHAAKKAEKRTSK